MPDPNTYPIYQAYVSNVRDFLFAECEVRRTLNRALKSGRLNSVKVQTKIYALLYSTFAEANFTKMVLTPYGFEQDFVNQILNDQNNLQQKWYQCIDLAFHNFNLRKKGSEVPNKKQELMRIVNNYIIDPSIIRNKIAHGQFSIAINRSGGHVNHEITQKLQELTFPKIMRMFQINKYLVEIVEDLIESPDYAHHANYYSKFQQLEKYIERSKDWSTESKLNYHNMRKKIPTRKNV
ncbi:hypothetical protein [Sphingobacterium siyangense]|jgi:hypothetical protein|uniref:hypothetical protein n=1 Tax=Sphingobacterium siyangense TaxID=459529 RepID=UPI003DA5BE94